MPKYTTEPSIVRTSIDEIGSLLNVERIPGEELSDYAERIYSTYVKRSSSTYGGLLNGINRALGLSETDTFTISLRSVLSGDATDPGVIFTANAVQDTTSYSNLIDGSSVVATGSKLTDTTQSWEIDRLVGFRLVINSDEYIVKSNTENEIIIESGQMSGYVGQNYTVSLQLEENELNGYALKVGDRIYRIDSNTSNTIYIESGSLLENTATNYKVTAFNPKVEITASKIYLYKEYQNEENFQLDKEIDLRGAIKFHKEVVDIINSTRFFKAEDLLNIKEDLLIHTFKKQTSEKIITREIVPAAKFFKLSLGSIKQGSVEFSEASTFLREGEENNVSQQKGNFFVEYETGAVLVNSLPSGVGTVSYISNQFPFTVIASPTVVNAFVEEDIKDFLFAQIEMRFYNNVKDKFISGQPKADMIEYIAELLRVKPLSWGE